MRSKKLFLASAFILMLSCVAFSQVVIPRESNYQSISQMIGDTKVAITYHRPNTKGRDIWGKLVPYGEVWRTGANNATTFEITNDVTINGQKLVKGKYSLHSLPTAGEWEIIFNKTADQWGSFTYDAKDDILRVKATPAKDSFRESMSISFENVVGSKADVIIRWGELSVPFTIDVGDFNGRFFDDNKRRTMSERMTVASYILSVKATSAYPEALGWIEDAERTNATFNVLSLKARLLAEMGRKADAIAAGEKAVQVGKAASPAANTAQMEGLLKTWKAGN